MHSPSEPRTLNLIERRPHIARLAPADVAFLLENHRGHMEVLPTGRRDRYRLTALSCVGVLVAPTCRFVIRPKIPLANVFAMLDPLADVSARSDCITPETGTEALDFLAGRLARRIAERVAAGLSRAYRERSEQGVVLHGRLDLPAQFREAPGRKDQLHSQYDDFSVDVPCNQMVKAVPESLTACPLLGAEVRAALRQALTGFQGVSSVPLSDRLWEAVEMNRLPAEYRAVMELCRLLADSLTLGDAAGPIPAPSFLLDMERVFEQHITRGIVEAFAQSGKHTVAVQRTHTINEPSSNHPDITIRPDLTIDQDGQALLVVDAKWKRLPRNAEPADLYQVLAYGMMLGAEGIALVYPGRSWGLREYRFQHAPLRLAMCTVPVGGSREMCSRSVRRLAKALKRGLF